jgi:ribosome-binding factor A
MAREESQRQRRVADRVREVAARQIGERIKDPRLGFTTVTEVRVTGDLHHATIFYTVLGDEASRAATQAALDSAKGRIRTEVGRALGLRLTPTIEFLPDALPDGAHRIEEALREAAARDAEVARRAAGAAYAGDPDPYVTKPDAPDAPDETKGARPFLSQGEPDAVRPD